MAPLYIALVHYPVLNRRGEIIASAITTMDLHDLARSCCTYGIPLCYIVTPLKDQAVLARRVISHWIEKIGRDLAPDRAEALERLSVVESIGTAVEDILEKTGLQPIVWATSAQNGTGGISHAAARSELEESSRPHLLLFGTGWGLAPSVFSEADGLIEPIAGKNGFNHLSVRCAASILMDRLLDARC
jgi:hypothetical protein